MQCQCGGVAKGFKNERVKRGVVQAEITYDKCTSCERVGEVSLFELDPKSGKLEFVKRGPPGQHWEKHGF